MGLLIGLLNLIAIFNVLHFEHFLLDLIFSPCIYVFFLVTLCIIYFWLILYPSFKFQILQLKANFSEDDYFFSEMLQKDSLKIKEVGVFSPFTTNFNLHTLETIN